MKVADAMSRDVCTATPDQTICEAACLMSQIDRRVAALILPLARPRFLHRLVGHYVAATLHLLRRAMHREGRLAAAIESLQRPNVRGCLGKFLLKGCEI